MDLLILAAGIAERVMYRFLDGRERSLRLEKLEREIEQLAKETALKDRQLDRLRLDAAAKAEAYRLVEQLDGLAIEEDGRVRRRPALVKSGGEDAPVAAVALEQLRLVVDQRRRELGAGVPTPQIESPTRGEAPASVEPAPSEAPGPVAPDPLLVVDEADRWTDAPQTGEPVLRNETPNRSEEVAPAPQDPHLAELAQRVRDRRSSE